MLTISPPGAALPDDPASMWAAMLAPLASAISDCEAAVEEFGTEIDPESAIALLPDFERVLGPDPCGRDAGALTVDERQLLAFQRWTARGGQSVAYFEGVAESVGTSATIETFQTFVTGRGTTGQNLINTPRQFEWLVTLPETE
ncbi:MAG: putative phage tail protein, partial [Stellaceae bacterium]